jgi:hypothetical protein
MKASDFQAVQRYLDASDEDLARALHTPSYVIEHYRLGKFRIGGPSQACLLMLVDMPPEQRLKYFKRTP